MSGIFNIRLAEGRAGEIAVRDFLAGRGWHVHDAATSACGVDHGPRMGSLTLPDLLVAKGGVARWVEVKAKRRAIMHGSGNYLVTGFAMHSLERYQAIRRETGIDVAVFFVHWGEELEVRWGTLGSMGCSVGDGCYSHEWAIGGVPHALWKWCGLRAIARVSDAVPGPFINGERTLAHCTLAPLDNMPTSQAPYGLPRQHRDRDGDQRRGYEWNPLHTAHADSMPPRWVQQPLTW